MKNNFEVDTNLSIVQILAILKDLEWDNYIFCDLCKSCGSEKLESQNCGTCCWNPENEYFSNIEG